MAKTFIAVPCMDSVPAQFAHSLATLARYDDTVVAFQIGSLVYTSRNNLARQALASGAQYILWLDSDMVFPPDLLQRLMRHMDDPSVDFVTAVYYRRSMPYTPVLYNKMEMVDDVCEFEETLDLPDHPFEVAGCGFGGVLMRMNVAIDVAAKNDGRMFDPLIGAGEDLSFCWRARKCGHKILCDPSIQMGHVGHTIITKEFSDAFRYERGEKK